MPDQLCPICAGHRDEGPLVAPVVWRDDLVWVKHVVDRGMPVPLGHLVVETARHTAYVDSLSDEEAAALGVARRRAAIALRAELDVETVHAYLSNRALEHVHEHVVARHRGTPDSLPWHESTEWTGAPRGDLAMVTALCGSLARHSRRAESAEHLPLSLVRSLAAARRRSPRPAHASVRLSA